MTAIRVGMVEDVFADARVPTLLIDDGEDYDVL